MRVAPPWGARAPWKKQPDLIAEDHKFIGEVMLRWQFKWNTADIARDLFQPESMVERALHHGRELRRKEEDGSR